MSLRTKIYVARLKHKYNSVCASVRYAMHVLSLVGLGLVIGASGMFVFLNYGIVFESTVQTYHSYAIKPAEASFDAKNDTTQVVSDKEKTVEEKICETFKDNCKLMIAIAHAESGMNAKAINHNRNGSVDCGLFQVNSIHGVSCQDLFDVDTNLKVAKKIYDKQGLQAWSAYNNGSYKKFL